MKALLFVLLALSQFSFADTTHEVIPVADTYVTSEAENRNFGSESLLDLKTYYAGTRLLLKFDKNQIKALLNNKDLVSARLELPIQNHYVKIEGQIGLFKMNVDWNESGATWKCPSDTDISNYNQDCTTPWLMWSHDPNNTIPYPYDLSPFAIGIINADQAVPVGFNIEGYVNDLVSGNIANNYGFAVYKISTNINDPLAFYSRESDVGPKIVLTVKDKTPVSTGVTAKLTSSVQSGSVPLAVHFDGSLSKPKTGSSIQKIELNLGNGYVALDKLNPVYDFNFTTEGEYQAILKVTDALGDVAYSVLNISVLGNENNNLDRNYGYWINFPQNLNIKYSNGQQAQLSGDICKIWKTQGQSGSCQWVDKQRIQIRAFFPDMTTEVSSRLNVTTNNNRRNFTFQSSNLSKTNLNVLTLMVGEIDPTSVQFGALKSKLEMRIMVLDQKIIDYENNGVAAEVLKVLREVRADLVSLADKIDHRNAKVPSILAQYNLPLQVDNRVSAGRYYSTMVGGFRYELSSDIGNLYQGDYANIKSRVTNINYLPDNTYDLEGYNFKYKYKNGILTTQNRPSFNKGEVHEYIFQDSSRSNLTDFYNFGVEIEEKFKWWARSLGSSEFSMPVMEDTEVPYWVDPKTNILYTTHMPIFSEKAIDNFGRLNRTSFKAILSGQANVDISDKFSFESTSGGTDYAIRADLRTQFAEEGQYELTYSIADFEGHKANPEPYVKKFHVDRTVPFIMLPWTTAHSTNEESFELPLTIADMSPFHLKVYVNGVLASEADAPAGQLSDALAVDLVEGLNFVRIDATDIVGNTSTINYPSIILDTTPPELANINLQEGELIRTQEFTIQGSANEALKVVMINGMELELGDAPTGSFSETISLMVDGPQNVDITLEDLAGNTVDYSIGYNFLLRLLDANLVSVMAGDEGKLKIVGFPGATRPGIEISGEDGFFNSDEVTANEDGSFELTLDTFNFAKVTAYDSTRDRSEAAIVSFKNDTTLAGQVRDTDDNPLPGVTVRILSSGQTAVTDASGTFAIANPALGDQTITIDGRSVPEEITQGQRAFSVITMNVSLGNEQKNIIERTIYLAPKYLDGTEVEVVTGSETIVSSPYAPGVEIEIPANAATFPGGSKAGTINMLQIPAAKTSVELLEMAEPTNVYALEPSGLKFNQPVKLTLPNTNEFPEGTELVILSKNSETGNWEFDGAAKVTESNVIETKPGMGITHFSEVYAAPLGMEIKAFKDGDKPSVDHMNGAVSTSFSLPSFKSMGQDISPALIYNSQWANPSIVISNVFDLPRKYMDYNFSQNQGGWYGAAKVSVNIKQWIVPESIDAQFITGDLVSEKVRFTGMPDHSLVSYQADLGDLPSGVHPAKSSYEIRFRELTIRTQKTKSKDLFGKTKTKTQTWKDSKILEEVFPQELVTTIYHQNKKDSEIGAGWRLNLGKRILNPHQDRIMVEHEDGKIASYSVKNTVETVQYDEQGIRSFALDGDNIYGVTTTGQLIRSTNVTNTQVIQALSPYQGKYGVNTSWYNRYSRRCTKSGWSGCKKHEYTYYYNCNKYDVDYSFQRKVKSMMVRGGNLIYLDQLGLIWNNGNPFSPIAGYYDTPTSMNVANNAVEEPGYQPNCQAMGKENCSTTRNELNSYLIRVVEGKTNRVGWCNQPSYCNQGSCTTQNRGSNGKVPYSGFQNGASGYAKFNQPMAITDGPLPDSLIVADYGNNLVRLVDTVSGQVTTFAGNQTTTDLGDGGLATSASIFHPRGVLLLEDGSVLVSSENGYIRRVTTDGKIAHFAGKPTSKGGVLADITEMKNVALSSPSNMALDKDKNYLYVADTGHNRIVRIDLNTEEARVVAGSGTCATNDVLDGKAALDVSLCRPEQITLDSNGNLLVLDEANKRIRRVNFSTPEDGLIRYEAVAKDNTQLFRNEQGQFLLSTRDGQETVFSAEGLENQTTDRAGRITSYQWDSNGRLLLVTLPTGQTINVSYSGNHLSSIVDAAGRVTQFNYSGNLLSTVEFPDGTEKSFNYNENSILTEEINQRGLSTKYILNNWSRLNKIIRPDGSNISMSDAVSQTISNNNVNGNSGELKSFGNDQNSLKDLIADAKGNTTSFLRDTNGYVQEIQNSRGEVTKVERDSDGRPTKIIKSDQSYTHMSYNSSGDLLKRYESISGTSEEYSYNKWGQLTSYKDPMGNLKTNVFDSQTGLLVQEVNPNGTFLSHSYGTLGLLTASTDALGLSTSYSHNSNGNVTSVTLPMGESTTYVRDSAGNVISKTNAKGQTVVYSFNPFNRLTSIKSSGNFTTGYTYLPTGELSTITNAEGFQTLFEYDDLGRVIKKTSPRGQVTRWAYDSNDNLISEITPNGIQKSYEYNDRNQLTKKNLPDGEYAYTYNEKGSVLSAANPSATLEYSYTSVLGEEYVSGVQVSGQHTPSYSLSYGYNSTGKRTSMQSEYINLNYSLDSAYRLTGVSNSLGQGFMFGYDQANRLVQISRPNSINTTFSFDSNSFLTQIAHMKNSNAIESFVYTRDQIGNRTSITSSRGISNLSYDNENQLISATHPEADELHQLEQFNYDSLGNRIADNHGSYSYDENKFRLEEDWKYIYAYDLNGNLISKQEKGFSGKVWNYIYSSENQLVQADLFEGATKKMSLEFSYDPQGRRVRKYVHDFQTNSEYERRFAYDGGEIIAELDEGNNVLARYTHSGLKTDDVLGVEITNAGVSKGLSTTSGDFIYLKDGLGSIQAITDSTGNIVQQYHYSSYGKLLKVTDSAGNEIPPIIKTSYTFTNRELDEESGLYYYRARYYDAHSGRFMQEDPMPGAIGATLSLSSRYIYGLNNPAINTDPSGKIPPLIIAAVVSGIIAATLQASSMKGNFIDNLFSAEALTSFVVSSVTTVATFGVGWGVGYMAAGFGASAMTAQLLGGLAGGLLGGAVGSAMAPKGAKGVGFLMGFASGAIGGFQGAGSGFNYYLKTNTIPTSDLPVPAGNTSNLPLANPDPVDSCLADAAARGIIVTNPESYRAEACQ